MQLDLRSWASLTATLLTLVLATADAGAATYGDTAFVLYTLSLSADGCANLEALSLPLDVSVSSRVYVSARSTYQASGSDNLIGYAWAELRDAGNTTTLATTQRATGRADSNSSAQVFLDSNGLLHTGISKEDPAALIYVAAPGSYLLKMHVQAAGGACTPGPVFYESTLSYILLSSAFDRIYADGFQAMLSDGREQAMTV